MPEPSTEPVDLETITAAIGKLRSVVQHWDHKGTPDHDSTRPPLPERIIVDAFPALLAELHQRREREARVRVIAEGNGGSRKPGNSYAEGRQDVANDILDAMEDR